MLDKQGNANDGYDDNDDGNTTTPFKAEYSLPQDYPENRLK